MKPDRDLLVPVALMLVVVLASWLGIAGTVLKEGKENGLYKLLNDWQTLIGALIALVAAVAALRPVYRQVAEMRTQSELQTFEYVRSRLIVIEQERALALRAMREADDTHVIVQQLRSDGLGQLHVLQVPESQFTKRTQALESLYADFQRAGFERWGSLEVVRSRHQLDMALSRLKAELDNILAEVRSCDPVQWAAIQAKGQLKRVRTPDAISETRRERASLPGAR